MQALSNINISHYQVERLLAHGGMADIYLALDTQTQEFVAIKMVHTSQEEYCERFKREIRTISALQHEHILPILDYGEYGSWCYFVMPYIKEGTLSSMLARGPLSFEDTGKILGQLASALYFAHTQGIVHRDIKPSNVLMHAGKHAYLSDFGLAKSVDEKTGLTISGYIIGTPDYMAPELIEEDATPLSDIYALGVLLYQMLTGRVPFKGTTPIAILMKQVNETPVPPSTFNSRIPEDVEQVVMCALDKEPQYRFQTSIALWKAYEEALNAAEQKRQFLEEMPTNGSMPALAATLKRVTLSQNYPLPATDIQVVKKKQNKTKRIRALLLPVMILSLLVPLALKTSFPQPESHAQRPVIHQTAATSVPTATTTPLQSLTHPLLQSTPVLTQTLPGASQPADSANTNASVSHNNSHRKGYSKAKKDS